MRLRLVFPIFQLNLTQNCVVIIITNINSGIDKTPTTIDQLNKPQDKPFDGNKQT